MDGQRLIVNGIHADGIQADALLAPDGCALFEINEALGDEAASLMRSFGFGSAEVLPDLSGRARFVRVRR